MTGTFRTLGRLAREHFWGLALLVVLLIASTLVVRAWRARHPGAMNVIESQAMDMSAMKPPVGSALVATEIVRIEAFTPTVAYTGSVAPLQEQIISPRVQGTLTSFAAYNGDGVGQGQLLAVIDSPDLQTKVAEAAAGSAAAASEVPTAQYNVSRMAADSLASQGEIEAAKSDLARARAMIAAAEKGVAQRQKELASAKANREYWQAEIARERTLLEKGAVSLQEFQSEKAQAATAEAELGNKQAMVEEARANVEAARADAAGKESMLGVSRQRASAAKAALAGSTQEVRQKAAAARQAQAMVATAATIDGYRYLRAPFAGVITRRYVSPGQLVSAGTAIINVAQIDQVRLQANVSDRQLSGIKPGAAVTVRFTKNPDLVLHTHVSSISPLADQASRTAVVEAIVANPGHKLLPGDAVTLEIAVSGSANVVAIPASALMQKDGLPAVWVARSEGPKGKMLYTCTMHPEIIRDRPGTCPKCGMELVPKTSSGNKRAHLVLISTGAAGGDRVEVQSGLSDGDEVIYQGQTYLTEGDTVFPTGWSADGPKEMPPAPGMESMPGMKSGKSDVDSMPGMKKGNGESLTSPTLTPVKGQKTYVCPMHPHEMSHDPKARCRLCGMKVVEQKPGR